MKPGRKILRYSLRTFLICVGLLAVWLGYQRNAAKEQKAAVEHILARGGKVRYDFTFDSSGDLIRGAESPYPSWLIKLAGMDALHSVWLVDLNGRLATDEDFEQLRHFPRLRKLYAATGYVTDEGLANLAPLTRLTLLTIPSHRIEGPGFEHLRPLTELELLDLSAQSTVTVQDEHLAVLSNFKKLKYLDLSNIPTLSGHVLEHIRGTEKLTHLILFNIPLTDDCIPLLSKMRALQDLHLPRGNISAEGMQTLRDNLPNCRIRP